MCERETKRERERERERGELRALQVGEVGMSHKVHEKLVELVSQDSVSK